MAWVNRRHRHLSIHCELYRLQTGLLARELSNPKAFAKEIAENSQGKETESCSTATPTQIIGLHALAPRHPPARRPRTRAPGGLGRLRRLRPPRRLPTLAVPCAEL